MRWKELSRNQNHSQTVGHRQYTAACCDSLRRMEFKTVSELFNFLFPTEYNDGMPEVRSSVVSIIYSKTNSLIIRSGWINEVSCFLVQKSNYQVSK